MHSSHYPIAAMAFNRPGLAVEAPPSEFSIVAAAALSGLRGVSWYSAFTVAAALLVLGGVATAQGLPREEAATLVAQHKNKPLRIDVDTVGSHAASVLATHNHDLYLNSITTLDNLAAKHLAHHKHYILALNGLTTLTPAQCKAFAGHTGVLSLQGLRELTDGRLAKKLAEQHKEGDWVRLPGVIELGDDAATALAETRAAGIQLDSLKKLTNVRLAEKLARQKNDVVLNDLKELTTDVARALAAHTGFLSLGGLTTLSDGAAEELAKQPEPGTLYLASLKRLSNTRLAEKLARHEGRLDLSGITNLEAGIARELAKSRTTLRLNGLNTLSADVAKELANHNGRLELDNLATISDEVAAVLARHQGELSLMGLQWEQVSEPAREMLRSNAHLDPPEASHLKATEQTSLLVSSPQ